MEEKEEDDLFTTEPTAEDLTTTKPSTEKPTTIEDANVELTTLETGPRDFSTEHAFAASKNVVFSHSEDEGSEETDEKIGPQLQLILKILQHRMMPMILAHFQ